MHIHVKIDGTHTHASRFHMQTHVHTHINIDGTHTHACGNTGEHRHHTYTCIQIPHAHTQVNIDAIHTHASRRHVHTQVNIDTAIHTHARSLNEGCPHKSCQSPAISNSPCMERLKTSQLLPSLLWAHTHSAETEPSELSKGLL